VINGVVSGGDPDCPYGPCNCAGSFDYSFEIEAGGTVTIAVQNNYDPGWDIQGATICFTPLSSPPP
jgi:hypothetical protein